MLDLAVKDRERELPPFEFDDELLAKVAVSGEPGIRIYPFDHNAVVAGRGSRLSRELNLDRIHRDGIALYRRRGGGCAVFLDPGNLIISIAFPAEGFGNVSPLFNAASDVVIRGLERAGIKGVYQDGISDLVMEDRKVGGSCFHRSRNLAYYSAALLVSPDLDAMETYLPHPPREPEYRRGRLHREFVRGLDSFFPGTTPAGLEQTLLRGMDLSVLA